jgi:hypothetical protein
LVATELAEPVLAGAAESRPVVLVSVARAARVATVATAETLKPAMPAADAAAIRMQLRKFRAMALKRTPRRSAVMAATAGPGSRSAELRRLAQTVVSALRVKADSPHPRAATAPERWALAVLAPAVLADRQSVKPSAVRQPAETRRHRTV